MKLGKKLPPGMAAMLEGNGVDLQGTPQAVGPQVNVPDGSGDDAPPVTKPVDRRGAAGKLGLAHGARALSAPDSAEQGESKQVEDQLKKLGYLPQTGKISQQQFADAVKKFLTDHKDDANPPKDIDSLMAMLDDLLAKQNSRQSSAQWSGQAPASRPSMLPSGGSYSNAPSPNAGALQDQATQSIATAHPPPPAGSINEAIAKSAAAYMGTSTASGPDHGNLACAWSVNNILRQAQPPVAPLGSNPNYVPAVESALRSGRGTAVDAKDAQPGDIVIFPGGHHIGVYMGNGKVANNSSGRAAFVNMSNLQGGMHIYRVQS
jgi:cell wall-associated NlpC family hydrolase